MIEESLFRVGPSGTSLAVMNLLEDSWVMRLTLNLIGYATIIVPGALCVYLVNKFKILDKNIPEKSFFHKCLNLLLVGNDPDKLLVETEDVRVHSAHTHNTHVEKTLFEEALQLMFCFFGLQLTYLTWGVIQEKIMTQEYHNEQKSAKFLDSQFLVFVNRILAFILAGMYILVSKQPRHIPPLYKYSYCSFSNIMSSWCQYEALKFISFPTQVLAKASKVIPVMLMGRLLLKKSYKYHEYATALLISVGMSLFLLSRGDEKNKETVTTFSGIIILCGYMVFDSFTSNWQGELFDKYHMTSVQMMCSVNFFSCIFTTVSLLQQSSFGASFRFMMSYPNFRQDCFLLSLCSALGQLFIFYTISVFGPIAFVIMMTIRQAIAILLSCLLYNHKLELLGWFGISIVFMAVFFKIYYNQRLKLFKKRLAERQLNGQHKV